MFAVGRHKVDRLSSRVYKLVPFTHHESGHRWFRYKVLQEDKKKSEGNTHTKEETIKKKKE